MIWQLLFTTLLVLGCSVYALWSLMPAALRQRVRAALGRQAVAEAGCGSGCKGCGPARGTEQIVRVIRRHDGG
jgi:hypothetical protein